jgi:hypothetical protein
VNGIFQINSSHTYAISGDYSVQSFVRILGVLQSVINSSVMVRADPKFDNTLVAVIYNNFESLSTDGEISLSSINDALKNTKIQGDLAAAVATLKAKFYFMRLLVIANGGKVSKNGNLTLDSLAALDQGLSLNVGKSVLFVYQNGVNKIKNSVEAVYGPGGPNPNAIAQGAINDCSFLSALISLTTINNNAAIKSSPKVTISKPFVEGGVTYYTVTFPGKRIPVKVAAPTQSEIALYGGAGANGLWVTIIEKAYCAVHTNLFNSILTNGPAQDVFAKHGEILYNSINLLTGSSAQYYTIYAKGRAIQTLYPKFAGVWGKAHYGQTSDQILSEIKDAAANGYIITAQTLAGGVVNYTDPQTSQVIQVTLPATHAYAILGVKDGKIIVQNPWNVGGPVGSVSLWSPAEFTVAFPFVAIQQAP